MNNQNLGFYLFSTTQMKFDTLLNLIFGQDAVVRTTSRWCTLKDGSARQMCASWTQIYFQNVKADTTLQLDCAK